MAEQTNWDAIMLDRNPKPVRAPSGQPWQNLPGGGQVAGPPEVVDPMISGAVTREYGLPIRPRMLGAQAFNAPAAPAAPVAPKAPAPAAPTGTRMGSFGIPLTPEASAKLDRQEWDAQAARDVKALHLAMQTRDEPFVTKTLDEMKASDLYRKVGKFPIEYEYLEARRKRGLPLIYDPQAEAKAGRPRSLARINLNNEADLYLRRKDEAGLRALILHADEMLRDGKIDRYPTRLKVAKDQLGRGVSPWTPEKPAKAPELSEGARHELEREAQNAAWGVPTKPMQRPNASQFAQLDPMGGFVSSGQETPEYKEAMQEYERQRQSAPRTGGMFDYRNITAVGGNLSAMVADLKAAYRAYDKKATARNPAAKEQDKRDAFYAAVVVGNAAAEKVWAQAFPDDAKSREGRPAPVSAEVEREARELAERFKANPTDAATRQRLIELRQQITASRGGTGK